MFSTCGAVTRVWKSCDSSNGRLRTKSLAWKIVFGLDDCDGENRRQENLKPEERLRKGDLPGLGFATRTSMKQISNFKRKLAQGKKSGEAGGVKQHQNGQQPSRKLKKPLQKKPPPTLHPDARNNLNVNERPIRKKKKTKKYESYQRNGKSPEPEVKQETNLLLALGLTPVKKGSDCGDGKTKLNKMHIMEEGNAKVTADAAELPEGQPDLPRKASGAGKVTAEPPRADGTKPSPGPGDSSPLPEESKVNGLLGDDAQVVSPKDGHDSPPNNEDDDVSALRVDSMSGVEVKEEPGGRAEGAELEEVADEKEKWSEPHDLTVTCSQNVERYPKASQNDKPYSNSKVISISVEQCQTKPNSVSSVSDECAEKAKKPKGVANRKRSHKSTDSDESYKASSKRNKFPEIDFDDRERSVNEYMEKACGSSLEELQMNTEKLQQEIHSLSALARAKELEWNDIIRLKKVKEEIYLRLVRRKQVMLLSMGGSGRISDSVNWDFTSDNRMTEFVTNDEVTYNRVPPPVSPKPPPRLPSNLTITKSQSSPSQNLQRFLMQPQGASSDPKPNTSLMMVPIVSSTPISISSTSSYLPHLGTPLKIPVPDRDKLKPTNNRNVPVPILPKPNQNVGHGLNNHSPPIGRQGPIVDVKSIIADYRQNHPEQVPRRGRRPKGQPSQNFAETMMSSARGVLSMSSLALGSGAHVRTLNPGADPSSGQQPQASQDTSRPSSADSTRSASNLAPEPPPPSGVSFKDVLVQFAKMSQHQKTGDRRNSAPSTKPHSSSKAPPYPEVTLHPVLPSGPQSPPNPSSSLLHGILTKNSASPAARPDIQAASRSTTFSPTLARLLTTPDRSSMSTTITTALRGSATTTTSSRVSSAPVSIADLLSTSKNRNELTITPIVSNLQPAKTKEDLTSVSDEDPDDNADRLVIDESEEQEPRLGDEDDMDGEAVPECQGCHMKSAQFVCAGCGNQWYCSRNCQVSAWDEHSEVCSG